MNGDVYMKIYDVYKDTYKKLDDSVLSNYVDENDINEFNACCDVCKSVDKNNILLSLNGQQSEYMSTMKKSAYNQLTSIIKKNTIRNEGFMNKLREQLANYNILLKCDMNFRCYINNKKPFLFFMSGISMASYSPEDIYNIFNDPVSKMTKLIYEQVYLNKTISETFDYFKDFQQAGIVLKRVKCFVTPDIRKCKGNIDFGIPIEYSDAFEEEDD